GSLNARGFNQQRISQEVEAGFGVAQVSGDLGLPFPDDGAIAAHVVERGPNVDRIAETPDFAGEEPAGAALPCESKTVRQRQRTRLSPPPVGDPEWIHDSQIFPAAQRRVEKG